jgi:hypothetical protein
MGLKDLGRTRLSSVLKQHNRIVLHAFKEITKTALKIADLREPDTSLKQSGKYQLQNSDVSFVCININPNLTKHKDSDGSMNVIIRFSRINLSGHSYSTVLLRVRVTAGWYYCTSCIF